jgi:hypothetical protein
MIDLGTDGGNHTYRQFYTCDSGIDCDGFGRYFFADFGLDGMEPTGDPSIPAYGFQGEVTCPNQCRDPTTAATDINENGGALWHAGGGGPMISVGRNPCRQLDVDQDQEAIFTALGGDSRRGGYSRQFDSRLINDLDQILISMARSLPLECCFHLRWWPFQSYLACGFF